MKILYLCSVNTNIWEIMCVVNVKMDDKAFELLRPCFNGDTAMQVWLEKTLHKAVIEYTEEFRGRRERESERTKVLQKLQMLKDNPNADIEMGGILGKPRKGFSWDKLREDAIYEKYGV